MTIYAWWIRGVKFAEMAKHSIASVRRLDRFMVDRKLMVLTDDEDVSWRDSIAPFGSGIDFVQLPAGRPAMVANLDAQIAALMEADRGERVLFLDADTLLCKAFPWEKDPAADLFVTWRDEVNGDREFARQQPYNYGVVGAVANQATIEAFVWMRARILQMAPKNQAWYGNQLALADLLGMPRAQAWTARVRWTLWDEGVPLNVCPLPCAEWNYSPAATDEDIKGRGILHLKGDRKDLIEHYAQRIAA